MGNHLPTVPDKCPQCGRLIQMGSVGWNSTVKWSCLKCHIVGGPCEHPEITRGREVAETFKDVPPLDKRMTRLRTMVQVGILRELQHGQSTSIA